MKFKCKKNRASVRRLNRRPVLFGDSIYFACANRKFRLFLLADSCLCRKAKTMGFLMRCALSSFSFLCTEEIFSISSNLIIQLFFLPSAVKVAFTSAVPFKINIPIKSGIRSRCYHINELIDNIVANRTAAEINKAV